MERWGRGGARRALGTSSPVGQGAASLLPGSGELGPSVLSASSVQGCCGHLTPPLWPANGTL